MKIFGIRIAGVLAAGVLGLVALAQPARLTAQATATLHGHVQNTAGQPVTSGEVRLTTDRNANSTNAKFDYTFPVDASGNYKGTDIKPANYIAIFYQGAVHADFLPAPLAAGENKTVDFDMSRKEYLDKLSPAEREALEEYKKKNAEVTQANAKIGNLNALLASARAANLAGNYDAAAKAMTDATTAKPDEAILWFVLGDAQLGQATAAAKAAHDAKSTDPSLSDKYAAAETSYQKALTLNAALTTPKVDMAASANNQLGQVYGKLGKTKEAATAYDAAAKADPTKAASYYYNEAATLLNANDAAGAATAADKAITADPTKAEAYYIKAEGLAPSITSTPDGKKFIAPPGLVDACNTYLDLAPAGSHASDMKELLAGLGETVKSTYKAPKK